MSALLNRLLAASRAGMARLEWNPLKQTLSTSQARYNQQQQQPPSSVEYDEEADDRDRFKYDKFYNTVVMFGTPTVLGILFYMAYLGHTMERHFDQDKYIPYPYLAVRNVPMPWGDGNHSLFHNPEKNWVPGVGFEKKQEKHH